MPFFMLNLFILLAFNMTFLNKTYSDDESLYTLLKLQTLLKADAKGVQNYWDARQINETKIPVNFANSSQIAVNETGIGSTFSSAARKFQYLSKNIFSSIHPKWWAEMKVAMLVALTQGFYNLTKKEPMEAELNQIIQNQAVDFYNVHIKKQLEDRAANCNSKDDWLTASWLY